MKEIAVIGGGASGMAAALAASGNAHVTIYEKNEKLGKKLFITGKGRCNLTNDADFETLISHVVSNPKFMCSSFRAFTPDAIQALLASNGCPVKTERGNRVFPVSDHSSDVIRALSNALRSAGVTVLLNTEVKRLKQSGSRMEGLFASENGKPERFYQADAVIIATGGKSYPATGSTGDGYRFAHALGLSVHDVFPALVPMETKESWPKRLQGLTLKNVTLSFYRGEKLLHEGFGEMLFTHFGVSGPVVLTASSYLTKVIHSGSPLEAHLDLKPALSSDVLSARIVRETESAPLVSLLTMTRKLVPHALTKVILEEAGIDGTKKCSALSKEERNRLVNTLKGLKFHIQSTRGFSEAVITQGGVDPNAIDPKTMRVKTMENVYFAGEVLDVDALTGGFNLQIAWSTGTAAGRAAKESESV